MNACSSVRIVGVPCRGSPPRDLVAANSAMYAALPTGGGGGGGARNADWSVKVKGVTLGQAPPRATISWEIGSTSHTPIAWLGW
jgi:hypothetical protein